MGLTNKQTQLAQRIDTWIKNIEKGGGGDVEILQQITDYMPIFKQLMDTSNPNDMNLLCSKYAGFYRFARLLEDLARGLQSGKIKPLK
jgi:hypothetical protein